MPTEMFAGELHLVGVEDLRRNWMWILAMGILLVVLGTIALGATVLATVFSVVFLGWLMAIAGVFEIVHGFMRRRWSGFFIELFSGVLYSVVGLLMISNPAAAAASLTLLIAAFLFVGGIFRTIAALSLRLDHWGWLLLSGVVEIVLAVMILRQWPSSGLWVIGLFVAIEMLINGWSLVMLALAARTMAPKPA